MNHYNHSFRGHIRFALILSLVVVLLISGQVSASSSGGKIFIANGVFNSTISQGNLDGTGGTDLGDLGGTIELAYGIALDLDAGKMYVTNYSDNTVSRANLDGTGGENLGNLNGTLNQPYSIALDTAAGKMYVTNNGNDTVSQADLDGSNGVSLGNFGGNLDSPMGIALDVLRRKIYAANYATYGFGNIVRANLNGTGGKDLGNLGGLVQSPRHIALDVGAGYIYIADQLAGSILRANLNGSGGVDLGNLNGTLSSPAGIALDLLDGKMYVTNNGNWTLSWADLDGTNGANLGTLNGTLAGPYGIAVDPTKPIMDIKGNGISISDGDDTPSASDDTDFGNVLVDGGTVEHVFTIENTGTADLSLNGTPLVSVSGANPGDFSVIVDPVSPVASGGATTDFSVQFNPSDGGHREAMISIDRLDASGNPYNFIVSGNGLVTPTVVLGDNTVPANGAGLTIGPTQITVEFNTDVKNDGSGGAANNISNYLLVEAGDDKSFNTHACGPVGVEGLKPDDTAITINSAVYENNAGGGPFIATLDINNGIALPNGKYRLFVCGTTSVEDLFSNSLNDSADTTIDFTVAVQVDALPQTGFAPGVTTLLPHQEIAMKYQQYNSVSLEIPAIGVQAPIVGIPVSQEGWDLTWLGDQAGWLHSTAFPSWAGNSAITAHVVDSNGEPGLFYNLEELKWGDKVIVHVYDQAYVYEVRSAEKYIKPKDTSQVFKHEDFPWLTLISCHGYDANKDLYRWRVVVRAVQTSIE